MSLNLNYEDMWHDLYDFVVERQRISNQYEFIAHTMEEMDPRLVEEDKKTEKSCEGCDGSGVRVPASPSCNLSSYLEDGYVAVEKCDSCDLFEDDLAAARAISSTARLIVCDHGGFHAIILPGPQ